MNIKKLYERTKNLFATPSEEFGVIKEESKSVAEVNKQITTPLAALVAIAALIAGIASNVSSSVDSSKYILLNAVIVFFLMFIQLYISGKLIILLGTNITSEGKKEYFYHLTAYCQIPFFLSMFLIKLFPSLYFLLFIALYSAHIFYIGSKVLTRIPEEKRIQFTILSTLIMIVVFTVFSQLLSILYSEIIKQFTTFAFL